MKLQIINNKLVLTNKDGYTHEQAKQVEEYLDGKRNTFDCKYNIEGTDFQKKVYDEIIKIPFGKTKTYKEIANNIECKSARAVGGALKRNKLLIIIPCHRVVGKNNALTGFNGGGTNIKKALLDLEK